MHIELWSDFACPFCYIGKRRFEAALEAFEHKDEVKVTYMAYQLNPDAPTIMTKNAYETFASSHHMTPDQAKQRFDMFTKNAKTVGLEYNYDIIQMTNTFDAHRLAKWAATKGLEPAITERFMKAYFTEGKNLAEAKTLSDLALEVGLDRDEALEILGSDAYKDTVRSQIAEGHRVGVQGVPFFVLDRTYGVSGAQQTEYFLQALRTIHAEQLKKAPVPLEGQADEDAACDDEGCAI
jgi:predicted DsbA family dithiol-disulfide isomerase